MTAPPRVVLDTNVVVSALLNPYGAPGRIWDLVLARHLSLAFDDRILIEYDTVLRRPKFRFSPKLIHTVLAICSVSEPTPAEPWPSTALPDPSDAMFLEVAQAASCPLITGNLRHFPKALCRPVTVLAPDAFLRQLRR